MPFTYRFTLRSTTDSVTFTTKNVPNWSEIKFSLEENKTYRGVFFEYSNVFEFSGDIRTFIRNTAELEGIDAFMQLIIEQGNESGHDSSFVALDNTLVAEFNETYELTETTVKLSFIETGFKQNVINREDTNTNLNIFESIDGNTIEPFAKELYQTQMHDRVVPFNNNLSFNDSQLVAAGDVSFDDIHIYYPIPVKIDIADDKNYQLLPFLKSEKKTDALLKYYLISDKERIVTQSIDIDVTFTRAQSLRASFKIFKDIVSSDDSIISSEELASGSFPDNLGEDEWSYNFTYSITDEVISLSEGDSMMFYIDVRLNGDFADLAILGALVFLDTETLKYNIISNSDERVPATVIDTIPIFEAITRNLQIITGQQMPFKSTIFGKTVNGYSEDGELSYMTIANGKMVRGFPYDDNPININLKDYVKDLISQFNLVGFFSTDGTHTYFNLEKFEDAYDLNESTEIELISGVSLTFADSLHFSNIKTGCKNFSYEEVSGLESFNGEFEWQTPLKSISKTLDIKLKKFRTDDYGLAFAMRKPRATSPTEDYRSDEDNFLNDCKSINSELIRFTKAEDFTTVSGIFSPDTAYNLRLSPGRQLQAWYSYLAASLVYKSGNFIKFVKGSKNPNLESQLIDEDSLLIEKEDVDINNLSRPIMIPQLIKFKGVLDFEKYKLIRANPLKTVKFTLTNKNENIATYGFIKKLDYDLDKGEAQMELIRANR